MNNIYSIRGQQVVLDIDLAKLYGTEAIVLRQTIKKNSSYFPRNFMFQLTKKEWSVLQARNNATVKAVKKNKEPPPFAFTEDGVVMLDSLLENRILTAISVELIRSFLLLKQLLHKHRGEKGWNELKQIIADDITLDRLFNFLERFNEKDLIRTYRNKTKTKRNRNLKRKDIK